MLGAWRRPRRGSDTLTLPSLHPLQSVAWGFASPAASSFPPGGPGGGGVKGRANHHGDTPLPPPAAPSTLAPGHQDKAPQGQRPTGSTTPSHPGGRSDYRKGEAPALGVLSSLGAWMWGAGPHRLAWVAYPCKWAERSTKYFLSHSGLLLSVPSLWWVCTSGPLSSSTFEGASPMKQHLQ